MSLVNILLDQLPNVSILQLDEPVQTAPLTYLNDFNIPKKIKQLIFTSDAMIML